MSKKRLKPSERYQDFVTRNVTMQRIVRVGLIVFLSSFLWIGSVALKQAGLNSYFSVTGRGEIILGRGEIHQGGRIMTLSGVKVSYETNYSEFCFFPGRVRPIGATSRESFVVMMYDRENPGVASCMTPVDIVVWLYVFGSVSFAIGAFGVVTLLFRPNSNTYRRLIGMRPISESAKKV